ncbi:MAG: hypothetical protein ACRC0L_04770 [Angustibacter sp.]
MIRPLSLACAGLLALSACTASGPKPLPSATPSPTPSRSASVLGETAKKQWEGSKILRLQLFEDRDFVPDPSMGEAWVDLRGAKPSLRVEITEKEGKVIYLLTAGRDPLVRGPGEEKWIEVGPKAQAANDFKEFAPLTALFSDPLTALGFLDKSLAKQQYLQLGTEKIDGTPVTRWKLILPNASRPKDDPNNPSAGLTSMTSGLELWVDARGFPVRILQNRKDLTFQGLLVRPSTDTTKFTRPSAGDILTIP